jgi:cell division protein FtsB
MLAKKRKIKKKNNLKDLFFLITIVFIFVGFVGFLAFSNLRINQKRAELREKIEELERGIEFFEKRNEELRTGILETETDPYWQARLYEQGFKKPGEQAIVIIPPEEKQDYSSDSQEKVFFENLLDWILMRN